jgi:hypothetical protein
VTDPELAFYRREGERFVPTGLGISPWNGHSQNGVALAGLVAQQLDAVPSPVPMHTARMTIDLLGAVPMEPLAAVTRVVREGKRLQMLDVELESGGRIWVRASALRVRTAETPAFPVPPTRVLPEDDGTSSIPVRWVEGRRVTGAYRTPGPGSQWLRVTGTVIDGEPLSPLAAVAMIADFGSGTAPILSVEEWTLANVDISIHLTRPPRGEWLLIDATSESAGNGIGLTRSLLGDGEGMFGVAHQTTFLERRAKAG